MGSQRPPLPLRKLAGDLVSASDFLLSLFDLPICKKGTFPFHKVAWKLNQSMDMGVAPICSSPALPRTPILTLKPTANFPSSVPLQKSLWLFTVL